MTDVNPESNELEGWEISLQPARCPSCNVAHLIPADRQKALCPACYATHLETQPTVLRPEPPELLLNYKISPAQVRQRFQDWLKGMWLRAPELEAGVLASRLTKTFIPMWLVDGTVTGNWKAQMGYDYQVASSQEVYRGGSWTTHKQTETRIRWEPRAGSLERTYQTLSVPALDEHTTMMRGIGEYRRESAPAYDAGALEKASVRVPSLLPEEAWPLAKSGLDRLAADDCQTAADAQHVDEYSIEADYQNLNWTQLLLPVYTTAYRDEEGKIYPVLVNGQTGKISGIRRASQKRGWYWTGGLFGLALVCFLLGAGLTAATPLLPVLGAIGGGLFLVSLVLGLAAPIPIAWAWNFNRKTAH